MPPPVPYTPRRRLVMTIVLWLLLGFTVGGAAMLAKMKGGQWHIALEQPATYGAVEVRLPKGWTVTSRGRDGGTQVIAREPNGRRVLSIRTADGGTTPETLELFMRGRAMAVAMGEELTRYDDEISVPGGTGLIIHLIDENERPIASLAYVVFGTGQVVVVDLRTTGQRMAGDEELLSDVTQSLRLKEGAPVQSTPDGDETGE